MAKCTLMLNLIPANVCFIALCRTEDMQSSFAPVRLIPPITVSSGRSSNVPSELSLLISESLPYPLNAHCRAEIGSFMAPFICLIMIIPLWSTTWKRLGMRRRRPGDEMPSHCGKTNVSFSCFLAHKPPLEECIFQELFGDKGFFQPRSKFSPFFPTVTMPDHHYTNGGALAFQGASIKEGKKSCSRRGEIHFVPSSNICCNRPSQKDARIKPKSPLIYCNDRQIDRQAGRTDDHMRKREGKRKRQKQLLSLCLSISGAFCVSMVVKKMREGVMGKAVCQIKLCWEESFMPQAWILGGKR